MPEPNRTPPQGGPLPPRPIRTLLDRVEADEPGEVTYVEQRPARTGTARLLGIAEGAPLVLRQRVVLSGDEPLEFISVWLDPDLARATGLDVQAPATASLRQLIESATGDRFAGVTEHLTARRPTSAETKALGLARNVPVLAVLATVTDTREHPVLAIDLARPGESEEPTDVYAL
jgi:DNA-binding GntR family transcriptional regulator